jgi:hypothetical protein
MISDPYARTRARLGKENEIPGETLCVLTLQTLRLEIGVVPFTNHCAHKYRHARLDF